MVQITFARQNLQHPTKEVFPSCIEERTGRRTGTGAGSCSPRPWRRPSPSPPSRSPRPPPRSRPTAPRGGGGTHRPGRRRSQTSPHSASPPRPGHRRPGTRETAGSPNLTHVANIPKNGDFTPEGQYSTDLAFQGRYAFAGNYGGFTVYDVANPTAPQQVAQVVCPGSQNDISVYGDLLVLSTDSSRSNDSCENVAQSAAIRSRGRASRSSTSPSRRRPSTWRPSRRSAAPHALPRAVAGRRGAVRLRLVVQPERGVPDCQPPHDLISVVQIRSTTPPRRSSSRRPSSSRTAATRAGTARARRRAATTSRPTRRRTSRRARAWATASCSTSPTARTRW